MPHVAIGRSEQLGGILVVFVINVHVTLHFYARTVIYRASAAAFMDRCSLRGFARAKKAGKQGRGKRPGIPNHACQRGIFLPVRKVPWGIRSLDRPVLDVIAIAGYQGAPKR